MPELATARAGGPRNERKDDGLSGLERAAYKHCQPLSCEHERCFKRHMYSDPKKQKRECGPLFKKWQACFDKQMQALKMQAQQLPPATTPNGRAGGAGGTGGGR